MCRKPKFQTYCLMILLLVETVQGATPDLASISSARLLRMMDPIVERGGAWAFCFLRDGQVPIPTETTIPPTDQAPWQDTEPDEVSIASFPSTHQLAKATAGDDHRAAPSNLPRSAHPFTHTH